ncbi:ankyrin repeat domain-containing protein 1-like [Dendronephthya gigantea]|uniref:ankyrin repeat domain-containing protein 1-like n=1 Tax=Dendronephthya gigantea TaxID=151771 RepID=UPI00106A2AA3|nr:ankyrin repeat domain-containing protein 1-like [Dendronephthya gigantea]
MNIRGAYPGSRQVFRSYSTNNLNTKSYRWSVPLRVSATDDFEQEEQILVRNTDILRGKGPLLLDSPSVRENSELLARGRSYSGPGRDVEQTVKHTKSFSVSKVAGEQQEHRKYSFKKLFEKKKANTVSIVEHSDVEIPSQAHLNKKIKSKPLLLRSLSSSCLSLATKSRPKLLSRISCPDNLVRSNGNVQSSKPNQNDRESVPETKPEDRMPTGVKSRSSNVSSRLKDSFKLFSRNSKEISKRDSRTLLTRFEIELAITKNDRSKLMTSVAAKDFDINAQDYYGKTYLHTACSVGNYHCAQILLNAGAKVDMQDLAGFTPLHCAVVANHVPCAAVLIAAGADVMSSTRTMHTAMTLAHEDEMILLIGRCLLLRGTQCQILKDDNFSLRETKL